MNTSRRISIVFILVAATAVARAQTTEPNQSDVVKALLMRIDKLEQRVAELEASKTTAGAPAQQHEPQEAQIPSTTTTSSSLLAAITLPLIIGTLPSITDYGYRPPSAGPK